MTDYNHDQTITAALTALGQGDVVSAAPYAQRACEARPDDAESWSVLGLCLARNAAKAAEAKEALMKATEMEPEEPRWWMHLGTSLMVMNDAVAAEIALGRAAELSNGHPQVMSPWADALMAAGRPADAAQIYGRIIQAAPTPQLWLKAGEALSAARDTVNAVYAFEKAYSDDSRPDDLTAAIADMHITLGQYERASMFNDHLRAKAPYHPGAGLRAANLLRWAGDLEGAKALQKEIWTANPDHAQLTAALLEEGDDCAKEAGLSIAQNESREMADRRRAAFALTHYFDKVGDLEAAWNYAKLANSLYEEASSGVDDMRDMLAKALKAYQLMPDGEAEAPRMVYVIGPPRSGGSLLQTVLSRSEGAKSVGERGALLSWLPQLLDKPGDMAGMLDELRSADIAGMTKAAGAAGIFIDKTPHHVLVTGLLAKVHAGAVFTAPWRNCADMAVSLYFHEFGPEFAFTRTLEGIADYLDFHAEAIEIWRKAGVDITDHNHDDFIQDPAKHGKALCEALDISWHDSLLDDTKTDSVIRTFSARQVRGGVSTKFAGRGERYRAFLAERFRG